MLGLAEFKSLRACWLSIFIRWTCQISKMKKNKFNKKEFDKAEREPVSEEELDEAMRQIFTAPVSDTKSENREPTREELNQKWKLIGI